MSLKFMPFIPIVIFGAAMVALDELDVIVALLARVWFCWLMMSFSTTTVYVTVTVSGVVLS